MARYAEDFEAINAAARLTMAPEAGRLLLQDSISSIGGQGATVECPACWEDVPREQTFAMSCGHRFCTQAEGGGLSCWHGHVENSLKSAGSAMAALCCPAAGCAQLVGPEEIERFGSARREPSAADTRGAA